FRQSLLFRQGQLFRQSRLFSTKPALTNYEFRAGPSPLGFFRTPYSPDAMPVLSSTLPPTPSPWRSSSRTAAARLGIRRSNLKSSSAFSSSGESMICNRSSRTRPSSPLLFFIDQPPTK